MSRSHQWTQLLGISFGMWCTVMSTWLSALYLHPPGYDGSDRIGKRFSWVKDRSPTKTGNKNRARSSLPAPLCLMPSALSNGRLGVFAKEFIEKNYVFGPFVGQKIQSQRDLSTEMDQTFCWDVSLIVSVLYASSYTACCFVPQN